MDGLREKLKHCSACGICTLSCPLWQQTHDRLLTFAGRAQAILAGAEPAELADSIGACILCGSCEPLCPVGIRTTDITLALRSMLAGGDAIKTQTGPARRGRAFIPGPAMRENSGLMKRAEAFLGVSASTDDGTSAMEEFSSGRAGQDAAGFIASAAGADEIIAADGLMARLLKTALPGARVITLGMAIAGSGALDKALGPGDLYVVDARAYNFNRAEAAPLYAALRNSTGCAMNIDLQRIAIPTATAARCMAVAATCEAQLQWITAGRTFTRIVAEAAEDMAPLAAATGISVIHAIEACG